MTSARARAGGRLRFVVPALTLAVLVLAAVTPAVAARAPRLRDGDLVFHTSRSAQSLAVRRATRSPWSHMGLVFHRDGRPFVLEAIATVRFTPFEEWIARGQDRRFVVRRLRDADAVLTPAALARLRTEAQRFVGREYDPVFAWSDERVYCSELAWKAYDRALGVQLGGLRELRDFDLSEPLVRAKLRERYGGSPPLREPVISPAAIFGSRRLYTAYAH